MLILAPLRFISAPLRFSSAPLFFVYLQTMNYAFGLCLTFNFF